MIGSMAAVPLPGESVEAIARQDTLQTTLLERNGIEIPVFAWQGGRSRILRLSAQLYNTVEQYQELARAVKAHLDSH